MEYVRQEIKDFISTNLTDIYPVWSPTTTYTVELDESLITSASMVRYNTFYYRSLTTDNLNFNPITYENKKWVKYQISNKYAMLDLSAQSKSVIEGDDLVVVFEQKLIKTLGIGNYEATYITVEILDSDLTTVLWTGETTPSTVIGVTNWYTYIYAEINNEVDRTIKIDLPILGSYVRVTLHKSTTTDRASCGYLVGGSAVYMGYTLKNVSFSYNSFALKNTDDFGTLSIKKRAVQDLVDFETVIPSSQLSNFRRKLKSVYDDIVMFILDERVDSVYENLLTLGVIQDASIVLENDVESTITFSVMESV